MGGSSKFYAVRIGKSPGVYHKWEECLEQVKGFKGATFQSFSTLVEAERFVSDAKPSAASSSRPSKFYAVRIGKTPGIYTDWPTAQQQVVGWKRPSFKSFSTRSEAQSFLDGRFQSAEPGRRKQAEGQHSYDGIAERLAKRQKIDQTSYTGLLPEEGAMPDGKMASENPTKGHQETAKSTTADSLSQEPTINGIADLPGSNKPIRIYTDGSALGNGKDSAAAGVGVYFGPSDPRNISEPLEGRQTNQRAELTAVLLALGVIAPDCDVIIVTDSKYTIDCITNWSKAWRRNGWKTSQGKPVENQDLIKGILAKKEHRGANGGATWFEWIKGHANAPGNVEADLLAVSAARRAAQLHASR